MGRAQRTNRVLEFAMRGYPSFWASKGFDHVAPRLNGLTREQVVGIGSTFPKVAAHEPAGHCRGEGGEGQMVVGCGIGRPGKPTFWLRSADYGNRQGVDVESSEEEGESDFGEHDDRGCREREEVTTALGLEFGR